MLKELDLSLDKKLAYGWQEDFQTRLIEWRDNLGSTFEKLRTSIRNFFSGLTSKDGSVLPEWVYTGIGGALDDVLQSLEKRLAHEDDAFRSAALEVLRNVVRNYRLRIKEASEKLEPAPTTPTPEL